MTDPAIPKMCCATRSRWAESVLSTNASIAGSALAAPPNSARAVNRLICQRCAARGRLGLSEGGVVAMQQQLNDILAMVDEMSAVDTTGVAPMSHPQEVMQRARDDRVTESDQRELFQSIAPAVEDGLYLVPRVIE